MSLVPKTENAPAKTPRVSAWVFCQQVREEFGKVQFPARMTVVFMSVCVVVMASIFAVFFFCVDTIIAQTFLFLLNLGQK